MRERYCADYATEDAVLYATTPDGFQPDRCRYGTVTGSDLHGVIAAACRLNFDPDECYNIRREVLVLDHAGELWQAEEHFDLDGRPL